MTSKYDAVVTVAWQCNALLGEGPIWDERTDTLYWIDIRRKILHAYTPANQLDRCIALPVEVGAVAPRAAGGLIAATKNGFAIIDPYDGAFTYLADPESDLPENRLMMEQSTFQEILSLVPCTILKRTRPAKFIALMVKGKSLHCLEITSFVMDRHLALMAAHSISRTVKKERYYLSLMIQNSIWLENQNHSLKSKIPTVIQMA